MADGALGEDAREAVHAADLEVKAQSACVEIVRGTCDILIMEITKDTEQGCAAMLATCYSLMPLILSQPWTKFVPD